MSKVSVIGTGSWGTAAVGLLAVNADEVVLLARSTEVAEAINTNHRNPRHLSDYTLPANVCATVDCQSIADADDVVIAVPSSFLR